MGLLKEAEKLKGATENLTSKGYAKANDNKKINSRLIKEYISGQIKREEAPDVNEPQHHISMESAKLQIKRPEGISKALVSAQKSPSSTPASIKSVIESQLKAEQRAGQGESRLLAAERVHSGIPGLDEVMEGGFRKNKINLIAGGAGCGKSIFCMQFLIEGIRKHGENGVYISFEETEDNILRDFGRFAWDIRKLIKERKLTILYYSPEQVDKVLKVGGGSVRDAIESINAKRIVLDSLTAFTLLYENPLDKRKALIRFVEAVEKWNVSALVTSEQEPDPDKHHSTILEFEVDGVILLYNIRKGDIRERSLEVFKMRGTQHSPKIFPMRITGEGIVVFPDETVF